MQRQTIAVQLRVSSATLKAAEIEAALGVKADDSWKIGDRTGTFGAPLKDHGCAIDASAPFATELNEHIKALAKQLGPGAAKKMAELAGKVKVELVCTIACSSPPPIVLEREDARWLAEIGGSLDVGVNLFSERSAGRPTPGS